MDNHLDTNYIGNCSNNSGYKQLKKRGHGMSVNLTGRKSELDSQELSILQMELEKRGKNKTIMYVLWVFTGGIGGHRLYLGDIGLGIAMFFLNWLTCGIWSLVDVFLIGKRLEDLNSVVENNIINEIIANRKRPEPSFE